MTETTTTHLSASLVLDKMLKAVTVVRTKGAMASVNLVMIGLVFTVLAIFGSNFTLNQSIVIVSLFICWQAFAIYALRQLPQYDQTKEVIAETIKEKTPPIKKIKG